MLVPVTAPVSPLKVSTYIVTPLPEAVEAIVIPATAISKVIFEPAYSVTPPVSPLSDIT